MANVSRLAKTLSRCSVKDCFSSVLRLFESPAYSEIGVSIYEEARGNILKLVVA